MGALEKGGGGAQEGKEENRSWCGQKQRSSVIPPGFMMSHSGEVGLHSLEAPGKEGEENGQI